MTLPVDGHVHSQWSWDAPNGSMERSCARAVELGLPGIAFTEHLDHTQWVPVDLAEGAHLATFVTPDGLLVPPVFDVPGYLRSIARCRELFPRLRIMSGLEIGEPHRHREACAAVLGAGLFDRVLGSLHCLPIGNEFTEPPGLYRQVPAADVVRRYLAEIATLVTTSGVFTVLAHIDYPFRSWPAQAGALDLSVFEGEFRHALRATAMSGRALEVNTARPTHSQIVRWWRQEGGEAITFGSDAHEPQSIARNFKDATAMAQAHGFRPGKDPFEFWPRTG